MKIQITNSYCRLSGDRYAGPGEVADVPDDEGQAHVEAGLAVEVADENPVETAVLPDDSEKAVAPRRKK